MLATFQLQVATWQLAWEELSPRGDSHHTSRDGEAHASGSLVSPFPPSGAAARPQRRNAAAEPALLTFASQQSRFLRQRSRRRNGKGHGGRGETGQGNWRLGGTYATHPPEESSGSIVFPWVLFWLIARHRTWSNSLYQWDPCPSVDGRQFRGFLPAYPPVELWFKLAESTIPGPNGDGLIYGGRSPR